MARRSIEGAGRGVAVVAARVAAAGLLCLLVDCAPAAQRPKPLGLQANAGGASGGASAATAWPRRRLAYTALTYEMPAEPELTRIAHESSDVDEASLAVLGGMMVLKVQSFPHDATALADAGRLLSGITATITQRMGGVVRARQAVVVDGYPGEDLMCEFPSTGIATRVRVMVGRWQVYTVIASLPLMIQDSLRQDANRFVDSVHFDRGDAPDPEGDGALSETFRYVEPVGAYFALRMPGAPRAAQGTFNTATGSAPMATYTVEAPGGAERWQVRVTVFNERPPGATLARVVSDLTSAGWALRDERVAVVQGYAGRAYELASADGRTVMSVRLYATESRLYDVRVALPREAHAARREQLTSYFESLRIL